MAILGGFCRAVRPIAIRPNILRLSAVVIVLFLSLLIAGHGLAQSARLIQPGDLVYLGAFRVPGTEDEEFGWNYGGGGLTYYPGGDPTGPDDGFPGSLFGIGHDVLGLVSEISIPVPVIPAGGDIDRLNTAETLQEFHDVRGGLFEGAIDDCPNRGDLEYLPRQGAQAADKLYFAWGEHYQFEQRVSHGWCGLDLDDPRPAGAWRFGGYSNFSTNDYLFAIPEEWAAEFTPGLRLAAGRFRDGGLGGRGPSLFAYGPWLEGNPPIPGATLTRIVPLLLYSTWESEWEEPDAPHPVMEGYRNADEWSGGAWLTAGEKSAIVFAGTKALGDCWYGFDNGVVWPDEAPYPPIPEYPHDDRGWWADAFMGRFIFYDPMDLAAVAQGRMSPGDPQPYAYLDIDDYLCRPRGTQEKYHLGAACFARELGLLFVAEFRGDGDRCLIHVWRVCG